MSGRPAAGQASAGEGRLCLAGVRPARHSVGCVSSVKTWCRRGRAVPKQQGQHLLSLSRRVGAGSGLRSGEGFLTRTTPDMPRGPVLSTPTPDHSGTDDDRKGGPLWLRLQGYVLPTTLCQDQLRVSATGVLVTTRTGFPPQVSPGI